MLLHRLTCEACRMTCDVVNSWQHWPSTASAKSALAQPTMSAPARRVSTKKAANNDKLRSQLQTVTVQSIKGKVIAQLQGKPALAARVLEMLTSGMLSSPVAEVMDDKVGGTQPG